MAHASAKVVAGCFALAAFAVAILAALAAGNPAVSVLRGAIIAMIVCYPVGFLAGLMCQRVVQQHVAATNEQPASGAAESSLEARDEAGSPGPDARSARASSPSEILNV